MLQADSSDPPPASPSSAGAKRSRHFCPFLSRSRSRAPCVRDPAPQGRRDRASGRGRCGALQGWPALLLPGSPSSPSAPRGDPAQRHGVSARPPEKGRSGLSELYGFQVWPGVREGGMGLTRRGLGVRERRSCHWNSHYLPDPSTLASAPSPQMGWMEQGTTGRGGR